MRLALNLGYLSGRADPAETLALAHSFDVEPARFLETISGGPLDAGYAQLKGKAMLDEQLDPAFALSGALKDVDLILAAAEGAGTDLGPMPGIREHLGRAVDAGHGDRDMAATWLAH